MTTSITSSKKTLVLKEEELRAFIKCSEFFNFKGIIQLPIKTALIEYVYIKLILEILKTPMFDYKFSLNGQLRRAEKQFRLREFFSINEAQELIRHTAIGVDEVFKTLSPKLYVPVFGAFEYPVNISKSIVMLNISSLLVTNVRTDRKINKRTYHGVTFSPYNHNKDMENDIIQLAKLLSLSGANPVQLAGGSARVKLHIFSSSSAPIPNYTSLEYHAGMAVKPWAAYLEGPVKLIENKYHYPIVPCHYHCEFKTVCNINPFRKRE